MKRASWILAPLLLLVPACTGSPGECPETPTLAASDVSPLALSCAEAVEFHDRDYLVGCLPVHPTRVGNVLVPDGGETNYRNARAIKGVAPRRAFILTGSEGCGRRRTVATIDGFSDAEFNRVRLPFRR